jgi:hypothetical protein
MNAQSAYEEIKADILKFLETLRATHPEAAKYLESHLVFDDKAMTFHYTGDDRIKLTPGWK